MHNSLSVLCHTLSYHMFHSADSSTSWVETLQISLMADLAEGSGRRQAEVQRRLTEFNLGIERL